MTPLTTRRQALRAGTIGIAAVLASPNFVFPDQDDEEELVPFLNMPRTGPNRLDWETLTSGLRRRIKYSVSSITARRK